MPPRVTVFGTPEEVVDGILRGRDLAPADIALRLSALPGPTARRLLVDRLELGLVDDDAADRFLEAFRVLRTGASSSRVQRIALDPRFPPATRRLAMQTLGLEDEDTLPDEPEGLQAALEENLANLVRLTLVDAGAAGGLASLLDLLDADMQGLLAEAAEGVRRAEGIPAARLWGAALERPSLHAVRRVALDALVGEGGTDAVDLLQRLRDASREAADRQLFQGALLRLCTAAADPDRVPVSARGHAWVSTCDGQGAFNVFAVLEGRGGLHTLAGLCVRAGGDVRDGYVLPEQSAAEVERFLEEFSEGAGVRFARVPLALASALAEDAAARTRSVGLDVPRDAAGAVAVLERLRAPVPDAPLPPDPPTPDAAAFLALLARPEYASWTWDGPELLATGAPRPPARRGAARVAWVADAATRLDTEEERARLAAMCAYMARWHTWSGEPEPAAAMVAAARDAERGLAAHPLVHAMLERSIPGARHGRPARAHPFGDAAHRRALRARYFANLGTPRARDLALLDFAEIAVGLLDTLLASIPSSRHPRADRKQRAGVAAARAFLGALHAKETASPRDTVARVAAALSEEAGLSEEVAHAVASELFGALYGFVEGVCGRCALRCHARPNAPVREAFYDEVHPALRHRDGD